jgi:periplasmic protein CpxP/Spy
MKFKFFSFFAAALIAFFAFGSFAVTAQDAATQDKSQTERRFKRGGFDGHKMRGVERLNLTEAQRQQLRTLAENHKNSTAAQRAELRQLHEQKRGGATLTAEQEARSKQLREEIRAARQKQQADFLAILTPEQRTEIEKFRAEAKERRREFGARRGGGIGGGFGKGTHGGMRGGFGGLNLSEAQQQQFRQIMEANRAATNTQREEIRQILSQKRDGNALTVQQEARLKELSAQIRTSHEKLQSELSAILTPEQRQQIEQRREEMRKRMEERRQMRRNAQPTIN